MVYSWAERNKREPFEQHIRSMLERWKNVYSKVYEAPLRRLIGSHADEAVRCSIILHDVGKLTKLYQKYVESRYKGEKARLGGYRHEVVSGAIAALLLRDVEWGDYVVAAVTLSHEPILMGQVGEAGERRFTLTQAYRSLRAACEGGEELKLECEGVQVVNKLLEEEGFSWRLEEKYRYEECLRGLKGAVIRITTLGDVAVKRVKVAALVHVLTVIDSLSASESRGDGDEGGTFVSRGAKKAEVAELWRPGL